MKKELNILIDFLNKKGNKVAAFKRKIDKEQKKMSSKYEGRNIVWYGEKGHTAIVPIAYIEEMEGNIFYEEKLEQLSDLIKNSENKIELSTSYGHAHQVDFIDILETQTAFYSGRFEIDYSGMKEPYTTGDEDLDKYIGSDDVINDFLFNDYDIYPLLKKHKFDLIYNKMTKEELFSLLKNAIEEKGDNDDSEIKEYLLYQEQIKECIDNEYGDIGSVYIQLRDGHHRARAAIESGERYICVGLSDEHLELAREKFTII